MLKRPILVRFHLNEEEATTLANRAKECGYSREAYIRSLLDRRIPRPMPPPDYHAMMRELHGIGNNLNQVAQKAHILNVIDVQRYDTSVRQFLEAVARIETAVILPVKVE